MRFISKMVIKEIVPPMLMSLVVFIFVFLMRTIAELAKNFIENMYSLGEIGLLLLYSIPSILGFVIPMSLLLGIILGLNRLSSDSEIISLIASGVSAHSLLFPILVVAGFTWFGNTLLLTEITPWANEAHSRIIFDHTSEVINSEVDPRIFNENFPGFIILVNDIDQNSGEWDRVFIFDKNDPVNPTAILADKARLIESDQSGAIDLLISDYYSYTFPLDNVDEPTQVSRGQSTIFHLVESENLEERVTGAKEDRAKSIPELLRDIARDENRIIYRVRARNSTALNQPLSLHYEVPGSENVVKQFEILPSGNNVQDYEIHARLPDGYDQDQFKVTLSYQDTKTIDKSLNINDFKDKRTNILLAQEVELNRDFALLNSRLERVKTNTKWIEIHKKFALPFTCIIFAFLALPLGLSSRRGGKAYGYIVGILVFIAYWSLLTTGERLAIDDHLSPVVGAWLPNIVFGLLAIFLFIRKKAEIRIPVLGNFLLRVRSNEDFVSQTLAEQSAEEASEEGGLARPNRSQRLGKAFNFPSILDRYVIKTFLKMFSLVLLALYALFSLVQYIDRSNQIQKNDIDPSIIFDFFLYQAPETLNWILPVSTLMGTLICLGILSKHLEVTAFKSSGVSIYRISLPIVVMAIVISMFSFFNQDNIMPQTGDDLARVKAIISKGPVQTTQDPSNRWILAENKHSIYFFHQFDSGAQQINELHIYDIDPSNQTLKSRTYANQASWDGNQWILNRGWLINYDDVSSTQVTLGPGTILPITEDPTYFGHRTRPADQMSYAELEIHKEDLKKYGISTTAEEFELNWKLSFPLLPLVMTIIGLPFAFTAVRKAGALSGIFISVFMVIVYWGVMTLFKAMGETGFLPALLAAWSPNIVFVGIGVLLFSTVKS